MNILELSEQEIVRRNSLDEMRRLGIDPYPAAEWPVDAHADEIKSTFADDAPQRDVVVGGRIMGRRIMARPPLWSFRTLPAVSRYMSTAPSSAPARTRIYIT